MAGYFDSIFNPAAGSPSAFTSPGMNPQMLQRLLQMQGGTGNGMPTQPSMAPQMPAPMQPQGAGMPPGAQVPGSMAGGGNMMQMLQQMMAQQGGQGGQPGQQMGMQGDPRMMQIRQILDKLRGAGGGMAAGGQPPMGGMQMPGTMPMMR